MSNINFAANIAEEYDHEFGPVLFTRFAKDLVNRIPEPFPHKILEVAAGTGRLTAELLPRVQSTTGASIMATDLSPGMLEHAKKHFYAPQITWQQADMQQLPFEANSFDCVIGQYGVNLVPDKMKAYAEMNRVLKPNGVLLFNVWEPETVLFKICVDTFINERKRLNLEDPSIAPKCQAIVDAAFSCADQALVFSQLNEAGFHNPTKTIVTVILNGDEVEACARGMVFGSPFTAFLTGMNEEQVGHLLRLVWEALPNPLHLVGSVYTAVKN
jgi:ubiquinone/menaquinone biosynthesis C-methylase UbiE